MDSRLIEIRGKKALNFLRDMESVKLIKVHETPKDKLKAKIKNDLESGFEMIRMHKEGNIKLKSAHDLIREL